MGESADPVEAVETKYFRRGAITAVFYAVVDLLIVIFGGPFIPLRLIGVVAAYFIARDVVLLQEAGVEWGWTRFLVLIFVAIGGFLGFIVYAWRRHVHIEAATWPSEEAADTDGEDTVAGENETVEE